MLAKFWLTLGISHTTHTYLRVVEKLWLVPDTESQWMSLALLHVWTSPVEEGEENYLLLLCSYSSSWGGLELSPEVPSSDNTT